MVMAPPPQSCPTLLIHIDRDFRRTTSQRPGRNCWRGRLQADCIGSRLGSGVPLIVHRLFHVLALLAALVVFRWVPAAAPATPRQPSQPPLHYLAAASLGVTAGAYLAGSANLWLTGIDGVGRSIEGALAGGILAIEALKAIAGIRGSTGL